MCMCALKCESNGECEIMLQTVRVGGGICLSRPIREERGLGQRMGNSGGLGVMPLASSTPPGGGYLIRGRKVGGNWGVWGVRLGTYAPSIHLEGGKEGDIITQRQQ